MLRSIIVFGLLASSSLGLGVERSDAADPKPTGPTVAYRTIKIDGLDIFCREAGPRTAPASFCCTDFQLHHICSAT